MKHEFATAVKKNRIGKGYLLRDLAQATKMDQSLISKIECGKRLPTDKQLGVITASLDMDYQEARKLYLAEKVYDLLKDELDPLEVCILAETRLEYLTSTKVMDEVVLDEKVSNLLAEVDELRNTWTKVNHLKGIRKEKMDEYFSINYTYESNKIEGNTLSLTETAMVINEGITISGKSIQEHLEAINHSEAIALIYDLVTQQTEFSKYTVMQLHGLILRGINREYAGVYRDVPVRISGSDHVPPQPYMVDKMMEDYFAYYYRYRHQLHPVILAAEMHERLVSIHPFIDGNGRTSRLIMNLILLSNGYPIAILKGSNEDRLKYYQALTDVQVNENPTSFYMLVLTALKSSMIEHIELAS